jgi:hypothetical protein
MKNLLKFSSVLAILVGIIMIVGGLWGICFTHKNVAEEKIVTAEDSAVPGVPLSGPRTLKAQADIIREHTLKTTGGKTFAEMPRQIAKLDADGKPVMDDKGQPVMVSNTARDLWVTATTLRTALHLAIFAYVFSCLIILFGLISVWTGIVFCALSKKY